VQQALIRSRLVRSVLLAAVATGPTGLRAGTRPVAVGVRPTPRPPQQAGGRESGRQVRNQARSRRNHESDPHRDHHPDHRSGIAWGGCSRPAGLAAAAPGGGVDAGPRRPGQGHGPPQAVPQGMPRALDAPGRGVEPGRVAANPWPGAEARPRRRRGRSRPHSTDPARVIGTCPVVFEKPRAVPEHLQGRGRKPSRRSLGPFSRSGDDGLGRWRHA
jgi:hypothetical protein